MKPLDLRIHEKHPTLDAYRFGPSYTPYAIVAVDKRFTDAELAAEYHTTDSADARDVILKFHTLPHYDEDDQ